jgi:hypothetical protein
VLIIVVPAAVASRKQADAVCVAPVTALPTPAAAAVTPAGQGTAAALLGMPELIGATNSSLDFRISLNRTATLYYVLIPQAGSSRRSLQQSTATWQQYTAADLRAAATGWGTTTMEVRAMVCR